MNNDEVFKINVSWYTNRYYYDKNNKVITNNPDYSFIDEINFKNIAKIIKKDFVPKFYKNKLSITSLEDDVKYIMTHSDEECVNYILKNCNNNYILSF